MSTVALQTAIVGELKADGDVNSLVAGRVYDTVPAAAVFPYISLGPEQVLPDRADCIDGKIVHFQIDVWSRTVGFPQAKNIAEAVTSALNNNLLSVSGYRVVDLYLENENVSRDPDGLTNHVALTFHTLLDPV